MAFQGDKKVGKSILHNVEVKFRNMLIPFVPKFVQTYHLTLCTILWSILILLFSFLAKYEIHWLWGVSAMILFQYITDLLDGEIGRKRKTGLIKWGYYMDHLLDYIFMCFIFVGYSFILPDQYKYMLFFILALAGGYIVNAYLAFSSTNKFKITYFGVGPTEVRILFIIINTFLIVFGKTYMAVTLPYVLILATIGLFITVYVTQKEIWEIDMRDKKNK
jgi:phosphatidylglycerophosphate synthase